MTLSFADPRDANYIASANQPALAELAADYAHLGEQLARRGVHIDDITRASSSETGDEALHRARRIIGGHVGHDVLARRFF